jgi:hypothetical protein
MTAFCRFLANFCFRNSFVSTACAAKSFVSDGRNKEKKRSDLRANKLIINELLSKNG